jgi:hypothetical protein
MYGTRPWPSSILNPKFQFDSNPNERLNAVGLNIKVSVKGLRVYMGRSVAADSPHLVHHMSLSPPPNSSHAETIVSLKRRIAVLEGLNADLCTPAERKGYILHP